MYTLSASAACTCSCIFMHLPCGSLLAVSGPLLLFFLPTLIGMGGSYFRFFSCTNRNTHNHINMYSMCRYTQLHYTMQGNSTSLSVYTFTVQLFIQCTCTCSHVHGHVYGHESKGKQHEVYTECRQLQGPAWDWTWPPGIYPVLHSTTAQLYNVLYVW